MLALCWFLFVSGVFYGSTADIGLVSNNINQNDISSGEVTDPKWQRGTKELNPSFLDDLEILNSDYFDDPKTTPTGGDVLFEGENEPVPVPVEEELIKPVKAPCLGCPAESDIENPKIQDIALFAFQEYSNSNGEDKDQAQFIKINKAQTQVVAGIKYILEIEVGWTNCTKSQYKEDLSSCQLDPTRDTFICDFHVIEKPWSNSREVVNAHCREDEPKHILDDLDLTDLDESTTDSSAGTGDTILSRKKRDSNKSKFGSYRDAEESDDQISELANFAIQQIDRVDDDENARLVVEVLRTQKQTVSGWLYSMQIRVAESTCKEGEDNSLDKCKDKIILPFSICDVKVLFQPWQTNPKKLTESQCRKEKLKKSKKVAKPLFPQENRIVKEPRNSGALIGGSKSIDPESPELVELTTFALVSLDVASNAMHAMKLVRVVSAKRQLVAGIRTTMELEVGYTSCRKNPGLDKSKCDIDESRDHEYCQLIVLEKPWLQEKKVIESKCGKRDKEPTSTVPSIAERAKRGARTFSSSEEEFEADHVEFGKFIDKYSKKYSAEEYNYRLSIFKDNMNKVKLLQEHEQGTATYGTTIFADLTEEEFTQRHLGLRPDLRRNIKRKQAKIPVLAKLADEFDWRHYNAVTAVKNQGSCGSCWAFSVSGNIEGAYAIKHGNLESFSEQELVDCDTLDEGCNGGLPENAYKVLEKLGGLETEKEYPYEGRDEKCHFNSKLARAKVSGFVEVSKNETEMAAWLVKNGPISIGINANAMQFYWGGVSHPWKYLCSPKSLDHGVLIVGYGVHTYPFFNRTLPYWVVKNSWGANWGEQGYYRVYRGDGTCGVNQMATSAIVV